MAFNVNEKNKMFGRTYHRVMGALGLCVCVSLAPASVWAQDQNMVTILPAPDSAIQVYEAAESSVTEPQEQTYVQQPAQENVATRPNSALPASGDGADFTDARLSSPGLNLPEHAGLGPVAGDGSQYALEPLQRTREEIKGEIRDEAFDAAVTGLLPLRPDEIRRLLKIYDETVEAVETPLRPHPEPEIVVETVPLDPGARPVEIKTAVGHVTTLNFVDLSVAPWPIEDVSWAGNFEVLQPNEGGWVMRITPMAEFAYGNMSIKLVDLKTPVTFTLRTHRDAVHYRMDARIPENGPMARPAIISGGVTLAAGNTTMAGVLEGIAPTGAEKLNVEGVDGRTTAYRLGGQVYVRTPLTLLSPAWVSSVNSADGMNVYTLNDAPVLLLSDKGRMVRASLSKKE